MASAKPPRYKDYEQSHSTHTFLAAPPKSQRVVNVSALLADMVLQESWVLDFENEDRNFKDKFLVEDMSTKLHGLSLQKTLQETAMLRCKYCIWVMAHFCDNESIDFSSLKSYPLVAKLFGS